MSLKQTAHDACARKLHAHNKGYFEDPFVHLFVQDNTLINSPLMNRGHWLRVKAVENTITNFSKNFPERPLQVVSLGAGMDTLYFRWAAHHRSSKSAASGGEQSYKTFPGAEHMNIVRFVEIDTKEMMQEKEMHIKARNELGELTKGEYAGILQLHPGDLNDPNAIESILATSIDTSIPTLFLAECVFVYLPIASTNAILQAVAKKLFAERPHVWFFNYDAISPDDRFGKMMVSNLEERGIHLVSIHDLPSVKAHEERYKSCGFKSVKGMTMKMLYLSVPPPMRKQLDTLEMIDDWDEWNLVHEHYCVVVAWNGGEGTMPPVF